MIKPIGDVVMRLRAFFHPEYTYTYISNDVIQDILAILNELENARRTIEHKNFLLKCISQQIESSLSPKD